MAVVPILTDRSLADPVREYASHFPVVLKEANEPNLRLQKAGFVNFPTQAHNPSI
jgi:hypothetical protein